MRNSSVSTASTTCSDEAEPFSLIGPLKRCLTKRNSSVFIALYTQRTPMGLFKCVFTNQSKAALFHSKFPIVPVIISLFNIIILWSLLQSTFSYTSPQECVLWCDAELVLLQSTSVFFIWYFPCIKPLIESLRVHLRWHVLCAVSLWHASYLQVLFELARFHAPSTIFLDELESLMSQRGYQGGGGWVHYEIDI